MKAYKLLIENNILETMNNFFKKLLSEKIVDSLLVYQDSPTGKTVIQTLVERADEVKNANPFVPLLMMNSARTVSQLTVDKSEKKLGAVMRSCEIRATVELSKLKQVVKDNLIIIGVDCLGTYEHNDFRAIAEVYKDMQSLTAEFISDSAKAHPRALQEKEVRAACKGCEYPAPEHADIAINFLGCDVRKEIIVHISEKLSSVNPEQLGLKQADDTAAWEKAVGVCKERRSTFRDQVYKDVLSLTKDITGLLKELEHCRRCYNCRKECPICYCRECIFDSRTFEHSSEQFFNWAQRKGKIRMPTDTLLFHLTRMNHMVISCVACGQCTSACPNNIPIAQFFKTIGYKVQALFSYIPGKNWDEEIPQSTFKEQEFDEVGK